MNISTNTGSGSSSSLKGEVKADQEAVKDVTAAQVRNIYAGTEDMTPGVTPLASGDIYFVYE